MEQIVNSPWCEILQWTNNGHFYEAPLEDVNDYTEQVDTCKCELETLKDIIDEFIERWQGISENVDDLINSVDYNPMED